MLSARGTVINNPQTLPACIFSSSLHQVRLAQDELNINLTNSRSEKYLQVYTIYKIPYRTKVPISFHKGCMVRGDNQLNIWLHRFPTDRSGVLKMACQSHDAGWLMKDRISSACGLWRGRRHFTGTMVGGLISCSVLVLQWNYKQNTFLKKLHKKLFFSY